MMDRTNRLINAAVRYTLLDNRMHLLLPHTLGNFLFSRSSNPCYCFVFTYA
jgi:hypothetical protein